MKFAVFGDFKHRHSPVGPFFWGSTLIFGVNMHHTWDIKNQNSCEDPKTLPFLHFFNIDKLKNFLKRLGCENCMVFVTAFYPWNKGTQPLKRESKIGKRLGVVVLPVDGPWTFWGLREAWYDHKRLGCENCMMFVTAFYPCYQMYFPLKSGTPAIKEREQHWETIGGLVLLTVHGPWPVWRAQRGLVWPKFAWLRKLHYVRHSILPLLSDVFPPEIRDHSLYRERATLENDWGASGAPCRWSLTRLGGLQRPDIA